MLRHLSPKTTKCFHFGLVFEKSRYVFEVFDLLTQYALDLNNFVLCEHSRKFCTIALMPPPHNHNHLEDTTAPATSSSTQTPQSQGQLQAEKITFGENENSNDNSNVETLKTTSLVTAKKLEKKQAKQFAPNEIANFTIDNNSATASSITRIDDVNLSNTGSAHWRFLSRFSRPANEYTKEISKSNDYHRALKIYQTVLDWNLPITNQLLFELMRQAVNTSLNNNNINKVLDCLHMIQSKHKLQANHKIYNVIFPAMLKCNENTMIIESFHDIEYEYNELLLACKNNDDIENQIQLFNVERTIYRVLPSVLAAFSNLNDIQSANDYFNKWIFEKNRFKKFQTNYLNYLQILQRKKTQETETIDANSLTSRGSIETEAINNNQEKNQDQEEILLLSNLLKYECNDLSIRDIELRFPKCVATMVSTLSKNTNNQSDAQKLLNSLLPDVDISDPNFDTTTPENILSLNSKYYNHSAAFSQMIKSYQRLYRNAGKIADEMAYETQGKKRIPRWKQVNGLRMNYFDNAWTNYENALKYCKPERLTSPLLNTMMSLCNAEKQYEKTIGIFENWIKILQNVHTEEGTTHSLQKTYLDTITNEKKNEENENEHTNVANEIETNKSTKWKDTMNKWLAMDAFTFVEYISAIIYSNNMDKVSETLNLIFTMTRDRNLVITPHLLTAMMWSCIESQRFLDYIPENVDPKYMFDICINEFNLIPTIDNYNELFYYYMKYFEFDNALNLLNRITTGTENGDDNNDSIKTSDVATVDLNTRTYNIFISGLGKIGRIDLIDELRQQMKDNGLKPDGATYMNLLDACAQNGQPNQCIGYYNEFIEKCNKYPNKFYLDINALGHVLNSLANYFTFIYSNKPSLLSRNNNESNENMDETIIVQDINDNYQRVLKYWNEVEENFTRPNIDVYNLLFKCLRNCCLAIKFKGIENKFDGNILDTIYKQSMNIFDNLMSEPTNHSGSGGRGVEPNTSFNTLFDIHYEVHSIENRKKLRINDAVIEDIIKIYDIGESKQLFDKCLTIDGSGNSKKYWIDLHYNLKSCAVYRTLKYLNLLYEIWVKNVENEQFESEWLSSEFLIITGVGMHSADWKPIIKPCISNLCNNLLFPRIKCTELSYNQGQLKIDSQSLWNYFKYIHQS